MAESDKAESTWSWGATAPSRSLSVMGLPSPFLSTAVASTRRNSWSRRTPAQVALGIRGPVGVVVGGDPGALVDEVPGPHHLERLEPVQRTTPRRGHVEPRIGVEDRFGEVHLDPAQGVDHALEAVEVELDVVVDGNPEILLDGADQLLGPFGQGGIDLVGAVGARVGTNRSRGIDRMAAVFVVGLTWRIITTSLLTPVTPSEHSPKALFCCLRAQRRGPHEHDVLHPRWGLGDEISHDDAMDLVGPVLGVADGGPGDHHDQGHHHDAHPQEAPGRARLRLFLRISARPNTGGGAGGVLSGTGGECSGGVLPDFVMPSRLSAMSTGPRAVGWPPATAPGPVDRGPGPVGSHPMVGDRRRPVPGDRRRLGRRRARRRERWCGWPCPMVLSAVVVIVAVSSVAQISNTSGPYRRTVDRGYAALAAPLVAQSNVAGVALFAFLHDAASLGRLAFFSDLDSFASDASSLQHQYDAITPPDPVNGDGVRDGDRRAGRGGLDTARRVGACPRWHHRARRRRRGRCRRVGGVGGRRAPVRRRGVGGVPARLAARPGSALVPTSTWVRDPAVFTGAENLVSAMRARIRSPRCTTSWCSPW